MSDDTPSRSGVRVGRPGPTASSLTSRVPPSRPRPTPCSSELFPSGEARRRFVRRFAALMVLSATIAAFGLLADSTAVVIGAMLVAPLMAPINATAAAHGPRPRDGASSGRSGCSPARASWRPSPRATSSPSSAGTATAVPDDLPDEILVRTFPGLLDLAIGVVAGLAGGYVLTPTRRDERAARGRGRGARSSRRSRRPGSVSRSAPSAQVRGAMLLFGTNLAAIVFAVASGAGASPASCPWRRPVAPWRTSGGGSRSSWSPCSSWRCRSRSTRWRWWPTIGWRRRSSGRCVVWDPNVRIVSLRRRRDPVEATQRGGRSRWPARTQASGRGGWPRRSSAAMGATLDLEVAYVRVDVDRVVTR